MEKDLRYKCKICGFEQRVKAVTPELAEQMGAEVDNAQRALFISQAPTHVTTNDVLAYSVYAFESYCLAIINPYAICVTADLTDYL